MDKRPYLPSCMTRCCAIKQCCQHLNNWLHAEISPLTSARPSAPVPVVSFPKTASQNPPHASMASADPSSSHHLASPPLVEPVPYYPHNRPSLDSVTHNLLSPPRHRRPPPLPTTSHAATLAPSPRAHQPGILVNPIQVVYAEGLTVDGALIV